MEEAGISIRSMTEPAATLLGQLLPGPADETAKILVGPETVVELPAESRVFLATLVGLQPLSSLEQVWQEQDVAISELNEVVSAGLAVVLPPGSSPELLEVLGPLTIRITADVRAEEQAVVMTRDGLEVDVNPISANVFNFCQTGRPLLDGATEVSAATDISPDLIWSLLTDDVSAVLSFQLGHLATAFPPS